jgi:acetoacetyl-CoA synthetase
MAHNNLLWNPSEERKRQANLTRFMDFANRECGLRLRSYFDLYQWSIDRIPDFWAAVWQFMPVIASKQYDAVVDDLDRLPGAKWFPGARLNFAENLLRNRDERTAFIFRGETRKSARMTYHELYQQVGQLAKSLREMGVAPGDRVVAYMPNLMETAIAMLAATAVGAIWSSCATDLGPQAVLDRFGQVTPKVLFTVDGYHYKGGVFSTLTNAAEIAEGIPSLEKVVVVPYASEYPDIGNITGSVLWQDFLSKKVPAEIEFEQLPFDHPALIMFSSGTTGKPKCIVQSGGGVLINHLKELVLHCDLKREDTIFYITTCSWMMWNWMLSSLVTGAAIVLFDGNPTYPDTSAMWQLAQEEKVSIFGTSAAYINYLKSQGLQPAKDYDLSSLREICQTGSALSAEGFKYVYQSIKKDLHFNSLSGGTEINGCFAIGNPTLPVYAGELQGPGLGMKMKCYDEKSKPVVDQTGELVCEAPAPSMPLYFWNDARGEKYREAYFNVYPNVWRHGDYIKVHSDTGGITFFGRSDAVLKPSGVRIGTSEIYNQVEKLPEIADSLAIGQDWKGDQRVILFVRLAEGHTLTEELQSNIKKVLRQNASPRHVPAKIIQVPEIPYTHNMKKVEIAVTNIIHGRPVLNRDSLSNPKSLDYYEKVVPLLSQE